MSSNPFSEHLILALRNPQIKIGPFDGKVATHITANPGLHHICTTPNQNFIPCPPYMTVHSLHIRADLRYGIHDHTLFPQPYVAFYSHLGAIPRKPTHPGDPLLIMWWDPTPNDFVAWTGGILLGTGSLATSTLVMFQTLEQQLQARVILYRENTTERIPPKHALDLIATLATALSNALIHLTSLKTTYTQMQFTVTEFQRYYLELVGLLDYMEIYQPRMRGWLPAASTVDDRIGVFTLNELVVQDFHHAGLPVWYIRCWKGGPFDSNVLEIVSPTLSDTRMDDYDPPFPTVYTGLLGGCEVVDAIHQFSRNWLSYKDPFEGNDVQLNPPASSSSTATSSSSPAQPRGSISKQPKPRTGKPKIEGRNKFAPLEGDLAPFTIPAWGHGLAAVDTSYSNLVEQVKSSSHLGHYVFPDPAHFITPKSDGKKAMLLTTWLLCREAWLACVASRNNVAFPTQGWRDILFMDFTTTLSLSDTKASTRRQQALERFRPETLETFRNDPQYATGQAMRWNGASYTPCQLPPPNIVRKILWELYELNFTYELQALDRRAYIGLDTSDLNAVYEREIIITHCFPFLTYKQPTSPMPTINRGLASNNLVDQLPYILQLTKLMSSWEGDKPAIFALHKCKSQDSISRAQASDLERAAARFYCQTFYNHFGCAAQIPHRLFNVQ